MKELVRLRVRPSRDGKTFRYLLDYIDLDGKRRRVSLGHADRRKAERQKAQRERELRMRVLAPESMCLKDFFADSLSRTGQQIRATTWYEVELAARDFVNIVGNIDYRKVTMKHGETYRQELLDKGNAAATVAKKLRHLKHIFQLAVYRELLDKNPLRFVTVPKSARKKVEVFSPDECSRIMKAASEIRDSVKWDLLIQVALDTAMRRGELLNLVWSDIDFAKGEIGISPKKDTKETWAWLIKDTERRRVPLSTTTTARLAEHQANQPEFCPYVFVPLERYQHIQLLRKSGKWDLSIARQNVVNNFSRQFAKILKRASVRHREFHDLRSTAISNWINQGMPEAEVMELAGHSDYATTKQFYVALRPDVLDRARQAADKSFGSILARGWHTAEKMDKEVT